MDGFAQYQPHKPQPVAEGRIPSKRKSAEDGPAQTPAVLRSAGLALRHTRRAVLDASRPQSYVRPKRVASLGQGAQCIVIARHSLAYDLHLMLQFRVGRRKVEGAVR